MDLDTGKTLATYPGFEGEIPMWDMEYSLVYSTEAKPMLASVYATYFLSPKPVDNLDLSAFDLGLYGSLPTLPTSPPLPLWVPTRSTPMTTA